MIKENRFFFSNIWTYWPSHKARIEKWLERVAIVGGKILLEFYNGHSSYYMLLSFLEASIFIKSYRRLHATRFYCVQSPFSKYSLSIRGSLRVSSCISFPEIFKSRNNFATIFNYYYLVLLLFVTITGRCNNVDSSRSTWTLRRSEALQECKRKRKAW